MSYGLFKINGGRHSGAAIYTIEFEDGMVFIDELQDILRIQPAGVNLSANDTLEVIIEKK